MKQARLLLLTLPVFLMLSSGKQPFKPAQKWVSLFNGKNLKNWIPKIAGHKAGKNFNNTFRVADGILSTRYNEYDSFRNRFGALYFNKKFTNYRLRFQYRFVGNTTPGAPSWGFKDGGVQYHCQSPESVTIDQPFPVCLEYNLLGGNGKDERPTGEMCANGIYVQIAGKRNASYCTKPTVERTLTADDWVTAEIYVNNGKITQYVNGEQVIQFEDPRFDPIHPIAKQFIVNGNDKVTTGYISIQSNSHPMDFRKIEIMEY